MHKFALATAGTLFAGSALAADLPRRAPPPVFTPVPVFSWTGFYAGVNAGYTFDDDSRVRTLGNTVGTANAVAAGARPRTFRLDREGFTGGGQVGYNHQFTPGSGVVVGVEADAAYTDFRRALTVPGTGVFQPTSAFRSDLGFLGTARGRVGYAFDRVLVYGTGGFAYGDVEHRVTFFGSPLPVPNPTVLSFIGGRSRIETGYAAGGGVEYAFPSFAVFGLTTTVKAEYLYYDLGHRNVISRGQLAVNSAESFTSRFSNDGHIVRAGLNLKFNLF